MHSSECCHYVLINFYLLIKMKGGGVLVHVYVWNTESVLTTESLDGYLPNLVGIKYS